jgi:hypothetical protein
MPKYWECHSARQKITALCATQLIILQCLYEPDSLLCPGTVEEFSPHSWPAFTAVTQCISDKPSPQTTGRYNLEDGIIGYIKIKMR